MILRRLSSAIHAGALLALVAVALGGCGLFNQAGGQPAGSASGGAVLVQCGLNTFIVYYRERVSACSVLLGGTLAWSTTTRHRTDR